MYRVLETVPHFQALMKKMPGLSDQKENKYPIQKNLVGFCLRENTTNGKTFIKTFPVKQIEEPFTEIVRYEWK